MGKVLKYIFQKDNIFALVFIFLFLGSFTLIPFKFEYLDPVGDAIKDLDLTDLLYSKVNKNGHLPADENIVLVNIGHIKRPDIAKQVNIIRQCDPAMIGLDVFFLDIRNIAKDTVLSNAFSKVENLFLVSEGINYNRKKNTFDSLKLSHPLFNQHAETGLANVWTEGGEDRYRVCRNFLPQAYIKSKSKRSYAFAVKMAANYDSASTRKFLSRNNQKEIINYLGNTTYSGNGKFTSVDWDQVLNKKFNPGVFKDKIVLLGYMGPQLGINDWTDKFYTPLNNEYAGRTNPDMYGVVIHANIISMILREDYINNVPRWIEHILGMVLVLLTVASFKPLYDNYKVWYDGVTKILVIIISIVLIYGILALYYFWDYKLTLTLYIVAILLSGDLLEVYYGFVKNFFSTIGGKLKSKLFKQNQSSDY